jgi:hypothetical protein
LTLGPSSEYADAAIHLAAFRLELLGPGSASLRLLAGMTGFYRGARIMII